MALGFIFGEGQKARTPEDLKRLRATMEALRGKSYAPRNVGEGLAAIGDALAYRMDMNALEKGEAASREAGKGIMGEIIGALGGGSTGYGGGAVPASAPSGGGGSGNYRDAIASIESGGRYDAVGPTHSKMGRALGKYQVMEANIGPWSEKHLGRRVSAEEFLANPQIQDAIFDGEFGSYVSKYGPEKAAQAWFGGEGGIGKLDRKDSLGTSIGSYGQKFMAALNKNGGTPVQTASLDPNAGIVQALGSNDPYGAVPATDSRGEDQRAKFRQWNPDPVGGEAANLAQIDPAMKKVIERAKQISGTNFVLGSGKRDADMQKKAVGWGWSKTMDSDHLGGGAADLWPVDERGQVVFDPQKQQQIVAAMKQASQELGVDMEAGADWKRFKDVPHFGMTNQTPMDAPIPTARPGQDVQVASLDPSTGMPAMQPARPNMGDVANQRIAQAFAPFQAENVTPKAGRVLPQNDQTQRVLGALLNPQPMGGEFAGMQPPETTAAIPAQPQPVAAPQPSPELPGTQVMGVGGAAGRTAPLNGQGGQFPPAPGQATQGAFPPAPSMPGQLDMNRLIELAADPNTPELGQMIVQTLLKQRLTPPDPMDALNRQKAELDIQKSQRDLNTPEARPMTAEERQQWGIPAEDTRPYAMTPKGPELIGGSGQTINIGGEVEARKAELARLGIGPDDPRYAPYALTGKMPREDMQSLTATDKKAILEADEMVMTAQTALPILDQALKLSDTAYDGVGASQRGWLAGNLGFEGGKATMEFDNLIQTQALNQLKAIFGAAPTEGERKILLDIAGSSSLPADVRKGILERAKQAVERRLGMYKSRAEELRGGTFYKPEGGTPSAGKTIEEMTDDELRELAK